MIVSLILFFIVIGCYLVKPELLMPLWLITTPIIVPILVLYAGIVDADTAQEVVWSLWTVFNRAFLLIILYEVLIRRARIRQKFVTILLPLLALCIYIIMHGLFFNFDLGSMYHNLTQVLYVLSLLIVFLLNNNTWPKLSHLFITCCIILIIQLVWIPLNLDGIFAYVSRYELYVLNPEEASLMPGSFLKSNMLSDFVSIVYLFICIDYFKRDKIPALIFYIITLVVCVLLVFSGSRMPVVMFVLTLLACAVLFKKKKVILIVGIVALLVVGLTPLISSATKNDIIENEGLNRISKGLSSFYESKKHKGDDNSTVSLSTSLIDKYFMRSPLIGNGLSPRGDNAYTAYGFDLNDFLADARLAYTLVEFGILGLLLFLFYYYKVIRLSCSLAGDKSPYSLYIIFSFLILFSITEVGIFYIPNYYYVFAYCFGLKRENDTVRQTLKIG